MFELQPTLNGKLLKLRPMKPDDFASLHAAASDPLIWEQHPESDRYKEEKFRKYFDSGIECGGALVILDATTTICVRAKRSKN